MGVQIQEGWNNKCHIEGGATYRRHVHIMQLIIHYQTWCSGPELTCATSSWWKLPLKRRNSESTLAENLHWAIQQAPLQLEWKVGSVSIHKGKGQLLWSWDSRMMCPTQSIARVGMCICNSKLCSLSLSLSLCAPTIFPMCASILWCITCNLLSPWLQTTRLYP